jgi:hypothetical protein
VSLLEEGGVGVVFSSDFLHPIRMMIQVNKMPICFIFDFYEDKRLRRHRLNNLGHPLFSLPLLAILQE